MTHRKVLITASIMSIMAAQEIPTHDFEVYDPNDNRFKDVDLTNTYEKPVNSYQKKQRANKRNKRRQAA